MPRQFTHTELTTLQWPDIRDWPFADRIAFVRQRNALAALDAPPRRRPPIDELQWDYELCGSYRNYEWGE